MSNDESMTKCNARNRAAMNLHRSFFGLRSSFVISASSFPSFIEKREHQFAFGDDRAVDETMTHRLGQTRAARFGQLRLNDQRVAGENRLAKFHAIRAHKITDATRLLREF